MVVKDNSGLIKWSYTDCLTVPIKENGKTTNIIYAHRFAVEINGKNMLLGGISNKVHKVTTDDMPFGFFLN